MPERGRRHNERPRLARNRQLQDALRPSSVPRIRKSALPAEMPLRLLVCLHTINDVTV
jgi:hypothetical protein